MLKKFNIYLYFLFDLNRILLCVRDMLKKKKRSNEKRIVIYV